MQMEGQKRYLIEKGETFVHLTLTESEFRMLYRAAESSMENPRFNVSRILRLAWRELDGEFGDDE